MGGTRSASALSTVVDRVVVGGDPSGRGLPRGIARIRSPTTRGDRRPEPPDGLEAEDGNLNATDQRAVKGSCLGSYGQQRWDLGGAPSERPKFGKAMASFTPWTDLQIKRASDEALLAHIRAANAHGRPDLGTRACGRLLDRYEGIIKAKARNKIPWANAKDVAQEVHAQVTRAVYGDKQIDVFKAYVIGIANNIVANYHRDRKDVPDLEPLPSEHQSDDEGWGHERGEVESGYESVESRLEADSAREVLESVLASRNDAHRFVIEMFVLGAAETSARGVVAAAKAAGHAVTRQNIYKIKERFLADYEAALVAAGFGDATGTPPGPRGEVA